MKHPTTVLSAAALIAGCMLQSACAEQPPVSGPVYDFDWHLSGAAEARPYQVFDDGQRIYLQFDDPKHVPAVFADTPAGLVLLHWHPDPPYVIVDQMEPALVFRATNQEARAVRVAPHGPPHIAHFGDASPTQTPPPRTTAP
ncbi:conjugal transfer protein TrbG [Paraburkholderia sp. Cy-641]|uniref:TrbG/VirB9 family P-type conjugative transfer protein n=1 Tax=Paraburkholderia sp. Cy-641 TaxID=2608337 RepID=UPI0014244B6C|nr:TrbG/VirB9 family P-type conjugative transfer protein [Paraburkholderia sp. Cy-641]NIF78110.1 conjugal transfer protein TrbG [Paraburkholderia sp. Cy-641]